MARGVVPADVVAAARAVCDRHLVADDADAETEIPATELLRLPELTDVLFGEPVLDALEQAMGGPVTYYPNFVMRLNRFTDWHIDNGFLPGYHDAADHLYGPAFLHLQCVIYLQSNDPVTGGGLDVVSGSHSWAEQGIEPDHATLFERFGTGEPVDSGSGDLLVFDGRLLHRGTPATGRAAVRKYGLFFSVSRNDDVQVERFLRYLAGRGDHLRSIGLSEDYLAYMLQRYDDVRLVRHPDSFLPDTVRTLAAHSVRIATIDGDL